MTDNCCKDCCCAQSWTALGLTTYTGKPIPEHIESLVAERDDLLAGRANDDREYAKLIVERDGLRDNRFVLNRALAIAAADLESFGHHHAASAARAALRGGSDDKQETNRGE